MDRRDNAAMGHRFLDLVTPLKYELPVQLTPGIFPDLQDNVK
jgi:hypothetical protein